MTMNLDFSGLTRDKKPAYQLKQDEEPINKGLAPLENEAEQRQQLINDSEILLKDYQHNKKLVHEKTIQINQAILNGDNVYKILIESLEVISLLTNEPQFYQSNQANLLAIYGTGLAEEQAQEIIKDDTLKRLERLTEARERAVTESDKQRLTNAIKQHERTLESP